MDTLGLASSILLKKGYEVKVYDLLIYGRNLKKHKNLKIVKVI